MDEAFSETFLLVFILIWEVLSQILNKTLKCSSLAMRQSLLLASEHDFTLQTNSFVASDEVVSATHLQIQITLLASMFIAGEKRVWRNAFDAGGERVSCWK